MKLISLLYHDVIEDGRLDRSGLPGPGAAAYKMDLALFRAHLEALARAGLRAVQPVTHLVRVDGALGDSPAGAEARHSGSDSAAGARLLLTFDDGGVSAHAPIADLLEARGWIGHFFVTAGRLGEPGFLDAARVRDLHARGHVIGSHSWSHPPRMSALRRAEIEEEWSRSVHRLSDVIGERVTIASVPGGFHSRSVAAGASASGLDILFTSEPVSRISEEAGCLVAGRYTLRRSSSPVEAVALATGAGPQRVRHWISWNVRKAAKRTTGPLYFRAREAVLRRRLGA